MNAKEQRKHKTAVQQLEHDIQIVLDKITKDTNVALQNLVEYRVRDRAECQKSADSLLLLMDRVSSISDQVDRIRDDFEIFQSLTLDVQRRTIEMFAVPIFAGFWGRLRWLLLGKSLTPVEPTAGEVNLPARKAWATEQHARLDGGTVRDVPGLD